MSVAEAEIARLTRRVRDDPNSTAFVALADALRREGRFQEGLQVLREGFRVHADHPSARVALGRIHLDMGHRALAAEVLADLVQADTDNLAAASLLARIYVEDGRLGEARPLLERLREANHPDGAPAVPALAAVSARSPRGVDPFDHPGVAARFASAGQHVRARAIWGRLLAEHPSYTVARVEMDVLEKVMAETIPEPDTIPVTEESEPADADAPRGPHPVARYGRFFWRLP